MINYKCLIADKMHPSIIPSLENIGFEVSYSPEITREELINRIFEFTGLVIRSKTAVDAELLQNAANLKFVARAGAGIDQLDVQTLNQKNIEILNAPEGNRDALGEHAIGMLLCLFNKIHLADAQVKQGVWDREGNRGVELKGKTIGLIGFGNMGQAFAKRLSSFGCKVLAYDKYHPNFTSDFASSVSLEEIFESVNILSIHTPLTSETLGMVSDAFINKFKNPIYLINTARGEIIFFSTLVKGIQNGKILGAALDVLECEKLKNLREEQSRSFNYLAASNKVLFTPHVAGWTFESYEKINEVLVDKIRALGLF